LCMSEDSVLTITVIPWDGDDWGIFVDYGSGNWRRYRVGTRPQAEEEMRRLIFDKRERKFKQRLRVCISAEPQRCL
jgi:hypothetical protein